MITTLKEKMDERSIVLAVIGLGYVGLPLACLLAEKGFDVIGVDIEEERIDKINRGVSPIEGEEPGLAQLLSDVTSTNNLKATTDYNNLTGADVIFINVQTPVDDENKPRYVALRAVCTNLGRIMKDGALVVVESTIAPGTMAGLVEPLLEENSGKKVNDGFYLGHCPERVTPGKLLHNLRHLDRVCGGSTPETSDVMIELYRHIVSGDLDPADNVTAELVKTAENTFRDINIAFANELAMICEETGGDFSTVRELVNKSPGRNVHFAGAGVGGHCIPKDPWLLAYGVDGKIKLNLIPTARAVNESMPLHVIKMLKRGLNAHDKKLADSRVLIMGFSYLENSDDTRHSPTETLLKELEKEGAEFTIHDPYVSEYQTDWRSLANDVDAVVFMVAHNQYRSISFTELHSLVRTPVIIDGRNLYDAQSVRNHNFTYLGIGKGK